MVMIQDNMPTGIGRDPSTLGAIESCRSLVNAPRVLGISQGTLEERLRLAQLLEQQYQPTGSLDVVEERIPVGRESLSVFFPDALDSGKIPAAFASRAFPPGTSDWEPR